jgi:CBS domain containing-hemolysin-like protein
MSLLVFFIVLSIGVSFLCSLLEAVILSVTPSYLGSLQSNKPKLYKRVQHLKNDIEKPLASILTFNTIAHTIGAAGAGAEAQRLFGSDILAVFSAVLTLGILFFSEIIPKSIGASNWKALLPITARILVPMVFIAYPLVWLSNKVSSLFKKGPETISKDEISAMADIGLRDGALESEEHRALKGLIEFEKVNAREILTPREKVANIQGSLSIVEAFEKIQSHPYSRIIVLDANNEKVLGYVLRTKIQRAYIRKNVERVEEIIFPLLVLPESISLPSLFHKLLKRREHICAIVDEEEKFLGVLTLEDLIEHMLGLEIYDEQDHLIPKI